MTTRRTCLGLTFSGQKYLSVSALFFFEPRKYLPQHPPKYGLHAKRQARLNSLRVSDLSAALPWFSLKLAAVYGVWLLLHINRSLQLQVRNGNRWGP